MLLLLTFFFTTLFLYAELHNYIIISLYLFTDSAIVNLLFTKSPLLNFLLDKYLFRACAIWNNSEEISEIHFETSLLNISENYNRSVNILLLLSLIAFVSLIISVSSFTLIDFRALRSNSSADCYRQINNNRLYNWLQRSLRRVVWHSDFYNKNKYYYRERSREEKKYRDRDYYQERDFYRNRKNSEFSANLYTRYILYSNCFQHNCRFRSLFIYFNIYSLSESSKTKEYRDIEYQTLLSENFRFFFPSVVHDLASIKIEEFSLYNTRLNTIYQAQITASYTTSYTITNIRNTQPETRLKSTTCFNIIRALSRSDPRSIIFNSSFIDFDAAQEEMQTIFVKQSYSSALLLFILYISLLNLSRDSRFCLYFEILKKSVLQHLDNCLSVLEYRNTEAERTIIQAAITERIAQQKFDLVFVSAIISSFIARRNKIVSNHNSMYIS